MKSNLDKFFKTDSNLETEGVWFVVAPGVEFLCRRFGGKNQGKLKATYAQYFKPYARQIEKGLLSAEKEQEIMCKIFVETSLVDWKGVEIDGKLAKFDLKLAYDFLKNYPDLVSALMEQATNADSYLEEREDLGNS